MAQRPLLESLFALGHIGELSRLLATFVASGEDQLSATELAELTSRTAGVSYRYPAPVEAIEVAVAVGFLIRSPGRLRMTELGAEFLGKPRGNSIADVSQAQGALVFSLLLDDDLFRNSVSELLGYFETDSGKRMSLRVGVIRDAHLLSLAQVLQQLGVLALVGHTLQFLPDLEFVASDIVLARAPLSEATLWQRLEEQRLRAKQIEEWVVKEEKARLRAARRPQLAEAVYRISEVNTSAGYDVHSYELDGSPRYIEVKSSTGKRVRFIWSSLERKKANELRRRYWIYFVPFAASPKRKFCRVIMFSDPMEAIASGILVETPEAWVVTASK